MATYHINSNSTGIVPYSSTDTGAPNFATLLANIVLSEGDLIYVRGDVDDSGADIEIFSGVRIEAYPNAVQSQVKVNDSGFGLVIKSPNVIVRGIGIYKDSASDNSLVTVEADSVIIEDCLFGYDSAGDVGICVHIMDSNEVKVSNCSFTIPASSSSQYGIYLEGSDYCSIIGNIILSNSIGASGIVLASGSGCNYTTIKYNIIDTNIYDSTNAIVVNTSCDYTTISHNVMNTRGQSSTGIQVVTSTASGKDTKITNNVVILSEDDLDCSCIYIPYSGSNQDGYFTIQNNSFVYFGLTPQDVTGDSFAIIASIENGVISNNNIFGFTEYNQFISNGAPNTISELGPHNTFERPDMLISTLDFVTYSPTDILSYSVSASSPLIGFGYNQHNMGVGYNGRTDYDDIISMIDTVTHQFGNMRAQSEPFSTVVNRSDANLITFLSDVFTDTSQEMNSNYRQSVSAYPQEDVYRNQFGWSPSITNGWPFTPSSRLYRASFTDVLKYKSDLSPFGGIACPANPGYGFSAYPCYDTGLWGHLRLSQDSGCGIGEPCIIEDDFVVLEVIQDTYQNYEITIMDTINPPCLEN